MHSFRTVLLPLLLLIILAPLSLAEGGYEIRLTPVQSAILPNESAIYTVSISNFDNAEQQFQSYTFNNKWILQFDPGVLSVPGKSLREFTLYIKPKTTVGYGTEGVTILFKNLNDKLIIQEDAIVHVGDPNRPGGSYVPSVQLLTTLPESVDPRKPLTLTFNYRNRNALNLPEVQMEIYSPIFQRTYVTSIEPLAERSEQQVFELDPYLASGEYPLRIRMIYKNVTINEMTKTFSVAAITDIREDAGEEKRLFRSVTTLSLENKGNVLTEYQTRLPTSLFRMPFSSVTPTTTTQKIAGERYYVWNVKLLPEEKVTLVRVENYRLAVIIIVLVLVLVLGYYLFRSPIYAVKETIVQRIDTEHTQGIAGAAKIRIFLKNRSGKQLTNVSVIDRVSTIVSYVPQQSLGSISPTKVVTSENKGTILKWELDFLEPYEERILTYNVNSKLPIIGKMTLPAAKVMYQTKHGKERVQYTGSVHIQK